MAKRPLPSPEVVRQLLRYEPETGKLFWKPRDIQFFQDKRSMKKWNTRYAGKEALTANNNGYRSGTLMNHVVMAHRVIWAVAYGEWPKLHIDHIDGVRSNNILTNLREVTQSQNLMNTPRISSNTSGYRGVSWHSRHLYWRACIKVDGKQYHLGTFSCVTAARLAYAKASKEMHGEFARSN